MALNAQQMTKLASRLWSDPECSTFALLDGAGIPGLLPRLYSESDLEFACLYDGEMATGVAEMAPYIARIEPGSVFAKWLLSGWGERRGIFAEVPATLEMPLLRRHFRKLNMVYGHDSSSLLFRYYDPQVMSDCLPICDSAQLKTIFGPVSRFVLESNVDDEDGGVTMSAVDGQLVQRFFSFA